MLLPRSRPFVLVLLVLAMAAPAARGQSLPIVPPPATTIELMGYAEALELSDEQRNAVLAVHDVYRAEYRRFDEGDVQRLRDDLLTVMTSFMRSGFSIPERDVLEGLIDRHGRAMARAKAIDSQLFDGMTPFLTERQLARLPRARALRDLEVLREIITEMASGINPGAGVDVSQLVRELELEPTERANVDPILGAYGPAYATSLRRTYKAFMDALVVGLDVIDRMGIRGMTPQEMFTYMQEEENQVSLQQTFNEESKPVQAAVHDVSALNLRTYRQLRPLLAPENAEALRDAYYERAFGEVHPGDRGWLVEYEQILELDTLDAEIRAALEVARDETLRRVATLTDQIVVELQALREYRTVEQLSGELRSPRQEKVDDLIERRTTVTEAAEATLASLAGPDVLAVLAHRHGDDEDADEFDETVTREVTVEVGSGGGSARTRDGGLEVIEAQRAAGVDPVHAAPAITRPEVDRLADALALGDEDRAVLHALHADYEIRYRTATWNAVPGPDAAATGGEAAEAETKPAPWTERQAALLDATGAADEGLFDDAGLFAADDSDAMIVAAARSSRRRAASQAASERLAPTFGNDEAKSDLARVVLEIGFDPAERDRLLAVLEGYAAEAEAIATAQREHALEYARVNRLTRRIAARGGEGGSAVSESLGRKMGEAMKGVTEADGRFVELNRSWVDRLASEVSADAAWRLRSTYYRSAYPEVFRGFEIGERTIERAKALPGLAPAQARAIGEIATAHRDEQMRLVARMIELRQNRRTSFSGMGMPDRADIERELDLERLRFERRELEGRTRVRLALALDAAQRRQVPALDLTRLGEAANDDGDLPPAGDE